MTALDPIVDQVHKIREKLLEDEPSILPLDVSNEPLDWCIGPFDLSDAP